MVLGGRIRRGVTGRKSLKIMGGGALALRGCSPAELQSSVEKRVVLVFTFLASFAPKDSSTVIFTLW